jgi:hypothetical protein
VGVVPAGMKQPMSNGTTAGQEDQWGSNLILFPRELNNKGMMTALRLDQLLPLLCVSQCSARPDGFSSRCRSAAFLLCFVAIFVWLGGGVGGRSQPPLYISCHPATHLLGEQQPSATVIGCCRLVRDLTPLRCGSETPCPSSIWATHNRPLHLLPVVGGWAAKEVRGSFG